MEDVLQNLNVTALRQSVPEMSPCPMERLQYVSSDLIGVTCHLGGCWTSLRIHRDLKCTNGELSKIYLPRAIVAVCAWTHRVANVCGLRLQRLVMALDLS
jgi:hypothetical protein